MHSGSQDLYLQTPDPKPEDKTTGKLSPGALPKTGGYGSLLISLMAIGSGILVSTKGFKKK